MKVATDQTVRNAIEMKLTLLFDMREFTRAMPVSFTLCETLQLRKLRATF